MLAFKSVILKMITFVSGCAAVELEMLKNESFK
jgi:hypothetical protein